MLELPAVSWMHVGRCFLLTYAVYAHELRNSKIIYFFWQCACWVYSAGLVVGSVDDTCSAICGSILTNCLLCGFSPQNLQADENNL